MIKASTITTCLRCVRNKSKAYVTLQLHRKLHTKTLLPGHLQNDLKFNKNMQWLVKYFTLYADNTYILADSI